MKKTRTSFTIPIVGLLLLAGVFSIARLSYPGGMQTQRLLYLK